ncbi:protein POLYCHOME-like [Lolium rigidum]|uniref:protein POLYCHOME-like n=1 Tax=Lolium rigidum TaxID=89674 RepID=UPI001F5D15BD|nr:protein POLYCHOME-like [Lolium rigidum]
MPEHREIKRTGLTDLSGGGFFIRRVASPGALAGRRVGKPLSRRFPSPSSNKENVPPVWAVKDTPARRRSPLPDWYPRTPLRDITAIAKAIERSRLRIAAARQQSDVPEQSPPPANLSTTVPAEQDIPHCTEAQDSLAIASGSSSTSLGEQSFKVYSSPSKSSLKTPTKPIDPALADLMEKKLSSSIEQIEKMVKKNLKQTPKAAQPSKRANQRRTLMSMR